MAGGPSDVAPTRATGAGPLATDCTHGSGDPLIAPATLQHRRGQGRGSRVRKRAQHCYLVRKSPHPYGCSPLTPKSP
eukprot:9883824-Alexandrium_andersonii.AAC.1